MKISTLKNTALALCTAALLSLPALSRAADTNTPAGADVTGPAKFYGPVTAVDTNAMTFTVGDQTFTVTSESHLTKDGKPAILADAVVGEPARGSYTKAKDGKLAITKVRFGKAGSKGGKAGGKSGGKGGSKKKKSAAADSDSSVTDTNTPAAPTSNQ